MRNPIRLICKGFNKLISLITRALIGNFGKLDNKAKVKIVNKGDMSIELNFSMIHDVFEFIVAV